ncbi:MAG: transcription elongation factor GreB [Gammaproteobacteria bacterium]|nr:transcription elongation factor GreB [Gammaproteobacteria bacterium]NNF67862.1 transcription elongation factor GreB [Gammaproteobacteria bacterium]
MSRWRPPAAKSTPYITAQGFAALKDEQTALWRRRRDVVKALSAAAAEGDRSENAEYIYRKKELAGIDRRIRYLQKRLPELKVVRESPASDRVFFGAWVKLERADGNEVEYRIVGPDEIDSAEHYISLDSPVARALMKKQIDDEIEVKIGDTREKLHILDIRYVSTRE